MYARMPPRSAYPFLSRILVPVLSARWLDNRLEERGLHQEEDGVDGCIGSTCAHILFIICSSPSRVVILSFFQILMYPSEFKVRMRNVRNIGIGDGLLSRETGRVHR